MKKKNLELKQIKIVEFVKNYFIKGNSPFLKKNHFALFEDGEGMKEIKRNIFNIQKKSKKFFLSKILNLIINFRYNVFLTNSNKVKYYKNLVITWGNESNLLNESFVDKYTNLDSKKFKDTFWIILSTNQFIKTKVSDNIAVVYPQNKMINFFYFFLYLINNFIFNSNKELIDQDHIIAERINRLVLENKNFSKIKNLLMPYEGQAFQKQIFFKQKKINKNLNTYGFEHTAPHSIATQLCYTKGSPDKLFVSGKNTKKTYSKFYGWSNENIITTFPTRYKNFNQKNFLNHLFLPYDFTSNEKITKGLSSYLNSIPDSSLSKFFVKIHPVKIKDPRHILLKTQLDKIIQTYKKKFTINSKNKLVIVVGFTSTAIVALEYGLSVIHICPNPDLDSYSNYFWSDIDIKRIDNYCFLYKLKRMGSYLNFRSEDKIKKILINENI